MDEKAQVKVILNEEQTLIQLGFAKKRNIDRYIGSFSLEKLLQPLRRLCNSGSLLMGIYLQQTVRILIKIYAPRCSLQYCL